MALPSSGLPLRCNPLVGALSPLIVALAACSDLADGAGPANAQQADPGEGVATQSILPGLGPCADGTTEQWFTHGLAGCAGVVTWANRATLCSAGYRPANAAEWVQHGGTSTHDYWTDDDLRYNGTATTCFVSYSRGNPCSGQPMRVCSSSGADAEGNHCTWTHCGIDAPAPDEFFGGCAAGDNATAGTLCVPIGGCADGSVEQVFAHGVVGCAGSAAFVNASVLCGADYELAEAHEWESAHGGIAPTHNYWVNDDGYIWGLPKYKGTSSACAACGTGDNCPDSTFCPSDKPMHVCTPGGSDPEGNACTWSNCARNLVGGSNHHYGGCTGVRNDTAGALCVPRHGCLDGSEEQHYTIAGDSTLQDMVACAGHVSFANASTLCTLGYRLASASEWAAHAGNLAPTHDYWTADNLRYSGTGSDSCSVSNSMGTLCPSGQPMHACTPGGTDAEGNACTWTNCGYNASSPNTYFGGCTGAGNGTAGAICVYPTPVVK